MLDFLLLISYQDLLTQSNVLTAFALAISIIALSFMAGEMFSMPSIRGFARSELYELGVSAVILLLAAFLIMPNGPFDMVTKGFMTSHYPASTVCDTWLVQHGTYVSGASANDPGYFTNGSIAFGQADYFLGCRPDFTTFLSGGFVSPDGIILSKLTLGYWSSMLNEMALGFLSGLYISFPVSLGAIFRLDITTTPYGSLVLLNDTHTMLVDFIGMLYGAFAAQKMLLNFVEESAMSVLLPFGLLLRAIPFSRRTGSTIIAVAFAAYFIYPLTILVNQQIWDAVVYATPPPGTPANTPPFANGHTCASNSECVSGICKANECSVAMTNFHEYQSTWAMCYGKNPTLIAQDLQSTSGSIANDLTSAYFTPQPQGAGTDRAESRLVTGAGEIGRKVGVFTLDSIADIWILPTPQRANNAFFSIVENLVVDVMRFAMMALLFIVIEIVITFTLLRDFSLLIGGESRIFGISKLA